ncbi:hypothetical protein PCO82_13265 [Pectobacteriaceae bacterium CE90]|nr:hypothetical protein PCO82_13265 [Pectobacteriaceae bacterium CE90]
MKDDKKQNQQSRSSGWGGKRAGAGAPVGNTNAVKHGERSRQGIFPYETTIGTTIGTTMKNQ